ncbi:constitutive coactivator of peroxisome proliferator-activated receptor gamma-like [Bacillus rossius redtenbacheri]|uniref:constitutive coactivator of peroxisome proliferator-activated receptor gamma-like n=1 Tax=Bacillus rossius redtenbacheri TaxID=93214 RepID=UPI002FDCC658
MGVYQLTTYLETGKPNAYCYEVNIVKLARKFAVNENRQPVIIVDGTSSLYDFSDFQSNNWLMGGQLRVCRHNLKKFVTAFKDAGIKLVFYFDGSNVDEKRHVWISRQNEKIKKQEHIFQKLKRGLCPNKNLLPALYGAFGRFILQHELDCEVLVSVGECDEEMAVFAQEHNCLAFLAQDSDFLIHKGAKYFLSMKHLDIKSMKTLCYNRAAFAESLSLNGDHLPLLGSLMGNDLVPFNELKRFHEKLCQGYNHVITRVRRLADYVRKYPNSDLSKSCLLKIADDIGGDRNMAVFLESSINCYNCKSVVGEDRRWGVMHEARIRHTTCEIPPFVYPIMRGKPYELSVGLEDFDGEMEAAAKVYRPMRQRFYGVLLHDDPAKRDTVEEWCVESKKISEAALNVKVQRVPGNMHPGLLRLWTENTSVINRRRWELFLWCISPALDRSALTYIDPKYYVPAAVLYYLVHVDEHLLYDWEVEAIISQAVLLQTMKDRQLVSLRTQIPEPRAVQVASLFGRGVTTVLLVMAACGVPLKQMMPWLYYDGKLFLEQFLERKNGFQRQFQGQVQCEFLSIRKFVYGE